MIKPSFFFKIKKNIFTAMNIYILVKKLIKLFDFNQKIMFFLQFLIDKKTSKIIDFKTEPINII